MNKKNLKIVSLFLIVMIALLGGVVGYRSFTDEQNLRGQYTFMRVKDNIKSLDKIVLTTPKSGTITIYRQDNSWHFKEAADYFVNMEALSYFYTMINNSVIVSAQKGSPEMLAQYQLLTEAESSDVQNQGTEVAVYDNKGMLLGDIILGRRVDDNNAYVYARRKGKSYIYSISDVGGFSGENQAWIPYPLFQIKEQYINSIEMEGLKITHKQLMKMSYDSLRVKNILNIVSSLDYQGIIKKDDFFQLSKNLVPKEIQFNMIGGLVYKFHIYQFDDEYWLAIDVLTDSIAYKDIEPYAVENQKYFSEWLFQLFYEDGEVLYGE